MLGFDRSDGGGQRRLARRRRDRLARPHPRRPGDRRPRGRPVGAVREAARHHTRGRLARGRGRAGDRRAPDPARLHARVRPGPRAAGGRPRRSGRDRRRARRSPQQQRPAAVRSTRSSVSRWCTTSTRCGSSRGEEITSVHAFGAGPSNGSFRHVLAVCRLESGAHAMVEFDDAGFAYEVTVEVLATDGDVSPARRPGRSSDTMARSRRTSGPTGSPGSRAAYLAQDRAWVESIRNGVSGRALDVGRVDRARASSRRSSSRSGAGDRSRSNRSRRSDRPAIYGKRATAAANLHALPRR